MTLYDDLGVDKSATEAEIKKAYRAASKKAHPDAGGTREEFDKLSKAKNVLIDPRLRKTYDETGRIEEPEPDNDLQLAVGAAVQMIQKCIDVLAKNGVSFEHEDLLGLACAGFDDEIAAVRKTIAVMQANAAKFRKTAKRFKAKGKKTNTLRLAFESQAVMVERGIAHKEDELRRLQMAQQILRDHEFERDARPANPFGGFMPIVNFVGS